MEPVGTNVFFLTGRPHSLTGNYHPVASDQGGAVYNLDVDHPISRYDAISEIPEINSDRLRLAGNSAPEGAAAYLRLPPLDIRISQLAEKIAASSNTNYDKALAIEQYLRTHFGYALDLPRSTPADPLANFLFERKQGHCEYFASSMAVMLRSLHIPSRLVNGFRTGEFNDLTGQYVIRASNAHSWVEAYFPGYGWVSFDPTPAAALPSHTGWSRFQLYIDAAGSFWREWIINYDSSHQQSLGRGAISNTKRFLDDTRLWISRQQRFLLHAARRAHNQIAEFPVRWLASATMAIMVLIFLLNLPALIRALLERHLRAKPARFPRESAALWYERMVRRVARRGWRKLPSQTPGDFVSAIKEPVLQMRVAKFTRAYESARFGRSADAAESLPEIFEEIKAAEKDHSRRNSTESVAS